MQSRRVVWVYAYNAKTRTGYAAVFHWHRLTSRSCRGWKLAAAAPISSSDEQGIIGLGQPASSAPSAPAETLSGVVERVTYHNPETGFCVLRVKARGRRDLVAVVGHAAAINAGEFISATGWWATDREHGLQFKATRGVSKTWGNLLASVWDCPALVDTLTLSSEVFPYAQESSPVFT